MRVVVLILLFPFLGVSQSFESSDPADQWAFDLMKDMTIEEKIGQLYMIRAYSNKDKAHEQSLLNFVKKHKVGGFCFFQGDPQTQARITNTLQKASDIPLFVAIDAEWGLGMRFPESTISFPRQLTLGAITNNNLIYQMGYEIANQLNRIGVNVNFAPVVDINNNPNNPVINTRSFGEDLYNVGAKSYAYMKGLQEGGIVSCAKHFPGHGDTDVDSHYDLPVLNFRKDRLDSLELAPFQMLSELGVESMMSAHLHVPSIDSRPNRSTSLSSNAINGILRNQLDFEGLVFTDALDMKGVTKYFEPGETEVEAFLAGNDILLLPLDVPKATKQIKAALESGRITEDRLNRSVHRILKTKFNYGLNTSQSIQSLSSIPDDINNIEATILKEILTEESLTLVKNEQNLIPIKRLQDKKFAALSLGATSTTAFQKRLASYVDLEFHYKGKTISSSERQNLVSKLSSADVVFVGLHDMSSYASKDYGITQDQLDLIFALASRTEVVLTIFGTPYALKNFDGLEHVLMAYEDHDIAQDKAAQALFGVFGIKGKLPITASPEYKYGTQLITSDLKRIGYDVPERVGIQSDQLVALDSLIEDMISKKGAPGCQILVAKDNRIVYQKAFGHYTYDKKRPVSNDALYDVASVTKILSSTISLMSLKDKNFWNENMPLKVYLPALDTTNKAMLVGKDILAHYARLAGWIPFYKYTQDEDGKEFLPDYYKVARSSGYNVEVCDNLYMNNAFLDSIRNRIYVSELKPERKYKYSDVGFYLFKDIIENESGFSLDRYCDLKFYRPLGLGNTCFNPLKRFSKEAIVPSEKDDYFRDQTIQGHVHDMGAAMLGGVGGHAGLFSNSEDLAILMQMLLNGGYYGGTQYLDPQTVSQFTSRYKGSTRRGLGFDMKELDSKKTENMCDEASDRTFGHLGFTGTAVWADPEYDLIFIFLSNRTYPSMNNRVFSKNNYRPKAMSIVYKAMEEYNQKLAAAN